MNELPGVFWPISCRNFDNALQEVDSYSSRDDFPMLGSCLVVSIDYYFKKETIRTTLSTKEDVPNNF